MFSRKMKINKLKCMALVVLKENVSLLEISETRYNANIEAYLS